MEHVIDGCICEGRKCADCKDTKCIGAFGWQKLNVGYKQERKLKSYCKQCCSSQQREYYQNNTEECLNTARTYRQTHLEEEYIRHQNNYQFHRDEILEKYKSKTPEERIEECNRVKAYYQTHQQETIARVKRWEQNNKEQSSNLKRSIKHRYRAKKNQSGGSFTPKEWKTLKAQYNNTCLKCGRKEPEIKLEADHVIPVSKGGTSNIDNIQPLCHSCNAGKFNKIIDFRPKTP